MMDDELDATMLVASQTVEDENGDGLVPALRERSNDRRPQNATIAQINPIPPLHKRRVTPIYQRSSWGDAIIIDFPAPKWQRNAARKHG